MNKVITINLGGIAFQLEDSGYDALRVYLDTAKARLQGNPDRDEILSDIERAIAEKFNAALSVHKNVVLAAEVAAVLAQMGQIDDEGASSTAGSAGSDATHAAGGSGTAGSGTCASGPRRLYRILEGRQLGGVCNGLGAYFAIDPTIFRVAFVILTLFWGMGVLVYLVMHLVMPVARTPEQKAEATGSPATAQEFIRRAREGYYGAMKAFPDREARRAWKREFRQGMREWRRSFHREVAGHAEAWRQPCPPVWPAHPGAGLGMPIFSLLHGALVVVWICTLISLLATGAVFGVALPAGVPVWVAILAAMFLFGMLSWPLKAARRAFYYAGGSAPSAPFALFCVIDAFVWVAVVAALLWLALHHLPHARDAVHNLPTVMHDMVNSIRDWWNK